MGRRGPKSSVSERELLTWEREWIWLFSGLQDGFSVTTWHTHVIPNEPKLQTHPILLAELRKKPIDVKSERHTSGGFLPEKKTWLKLLQAKTVREVRDVCRGSRYWATPEVRIRDSNAFYLLSVLCDLAMVFVAAKREKRYPKSKRTTSAEKQIRFLARAMAGGCLGMMPRYANEQFSAETETQEPT
jgi:hypothetical protein